MDSSNSRLCRNGINILWGLSLLPHLAFVALLNSLGRSKYGRSYDGTHTEVEDTPPFDDVGNVPFGMARSGVVHATSGPDESTGGTCQCSDGGHDRCICGLDGT